MASGASASRAGVTSLSLDLFGGLRIRCADRDLAEQLPGRQGRALVAYLVLNRDRPVSRDELLNVLWPSNPPAAPEAALTSVLAKVRRALEPGQISGRQALTLQLPPGSEIDVESVQTQIARAERALGEHDVAAALEAAQAVLDVLGRPLLPDLTGDWIESWRQRLDDLAPRALEVGAKAGVALGHGHLPAAERLAGALVAREPFREAGHALLMQAQAGQGNVAEALLTFEQVRVFLRDELGASPSPSLVALHEQLLREDRAPSPVPLAAAAGGGGAAVMPTVTSQLIDGAFVGRDELSARLRVRWEESRDGPTRLVLLVGEAGVGKSRLAAEFAEEVHAGGAIVLYGRADEDALLPHQPFVEALRHLIAHGDAPLVAAAEQDREILCRLLPDLAPAGVALEQPRGSDDTLRYRLFEAVATLLRAASASAPVLLILDDLHWSDKPTLLLLRHLLRHQQLTNVLIVGTFRRVEVGRDHPLLALLGDLRRERRFDRLTVAGLDEVATRALVADRLGRPVTPEFIRRLRQQTEGNAFFIEETIRALVESGLSTDETISDAELERVGVPEGVAEIVGRRVSHLSALSAETLTAASVVGRYFRLGIVAQIVGEPPERVLGALEESMEAGLVREDPDRIDLYAFSHALVRAVLYERISVSRRVRLHHSVAEALQVLARSDGVNPAELAHHFLAARHMTGPDPARRYAIAAGDRATELLAYEEAVEHYRQAATLCADDEARCDVLLALGRAQRRAGSDEARATFRTAAESAARRGDADQLARAALGHSARYHESGYASDRQELLEQALAAVGSDDSAQRVLLLSRLAGSAAFAAGQRERAEDASAEALAIARRLGDESLLLAGLMARHAALLHVRHVDERLALSEEFMGLGVDHRELLVERRHWRMYDLLESADVDGARSEHHAMQELATHLRQPQWQSIAAGWRGSLAELDGDVELAERCAEECFELGRRAHMRDARSTFTAKLLMLRGRQGRLHELAPVVQQLVNKDDVRKTGWRSAYGLILAGQGDEARARAIYREELRTVDAALPAFWLTSVVVLSELCAALRDADGARTLYDALAPYAHRAIVVSYSSCWGPVDRPLALLAGVLGDDEARRCHARAALARAREMRAPLLVAELAALQA